MTFYLYLYLQHIDVSSLLISTLLGSWITTEVMNVSCVLRNVNFFYVVNATNYALAYEDFFTCAEFSLLRPRSLEIISVLRFLQSAKRLSR
jgi:hypothetical protein